MRFKTALIATMFTGLMAFGSSGCTKKQVDTKQNPQQQQQPQQQPQPQTQSPVVQNQPAPTTAPAPNGPTKSAAPVTKNPTIPAIDPNANLKDPEAPPVDVVPPAYAGSSGGNGYGRKTRGGCKTGDCGNSNPSPCTSGNCRGGRLAPVVAVPAAPDSARCQELDSYDAFTSMTTRWSVHLEPKLNLKGVKHSKDVAKQLDIDLNDRVRPVFLRTIYDGLVAIRNVNPALACAIIDKTSKKTLELDGPSKDGDKSPDGVGFKRHKFLVFGAGRILIGREIYETLAVISGAAVADCVNGYMTFTTSREWAESNATVAKSAIFEAFLHFADIKPGDEHDRAEETGVGGEGDGILSCQAVAYPGSSSVNSDQANATCRALPPCDQPPAPPQPPCPPAVQQPPTPTPIPAPAPVAPAQPPCPPAVQQPPTPIPAPAPVATTQPPCPPAADDQGAAPVAQ